MKIFAIAFFLIYAIPALCLIGAGMIAVLNNLSLGHRGSGRMALKGLAMFLFWPGALAMSRINSAQYVGDRPSQLWRVIMFLFLPGALAEESAWQK